MLSEARREFLSWCLGRAELHGGDHISPEVRLCIERTRALIESSSPAREELAAQERLFLIHPHPAGDDGLSRSALDASWAILIELAEAPRRHALSLTLASMARTACLRKLEAAHFASRAMTDHQAKKSRPALNTNFNVQSQRAYEAELELYEQKRAGAAP